MPAQLENEYSILPLAPSCYRMSGFLPMRTRTVAKVLRSLRDDNGTGPDELPARILKACATPLARSIASLLRKALREGVWPCSWKRQWIFPIHKEKSKSDPGNYRGIHLTSQLSKIAERVLGHILQIFLKRIDAYGPNPFAYRRQMGLKRCLGILCRFLDVGIQPRKANWSVLL